MDTFSAEDDNHLIGSWDGLEIATTLEKKLKLSLQEKNPIWNLQFYSQSPTTLY